MLESPRMARRSLLRYGLASAAIQAYAPKRFPTGVFSASGRPSGVIVPQTYGGVPDGVRDNFGPLTKAVAAAATAGKPVFLSSGVWYADTGRVGGWNGINLPSGLEVYGEPGTVLTWKTTYYEAYPYFGVGDAYSGSAHRTSGVSIHDLTFADTHGGNAVMSAAGTANIALRNLTMRGCGVNSLFACIDSVIENCTVDGSIARASLRSPLRVGHTYASLSVTPLRAALPKGTQLYVYADRTYTDNTFLVVYTAAASSVGATTVPLVPVAAPAALPVGASVRQIVISTGLAMTGAYNNWNTTPGPNGSWVVNSAIRNCTVRNCDAANIFINMGYRSTIENCYGSVGHDMNFDFEYCVQSVMQNNESHFGGNRGCAVETINSQCQVLGNKVYNALWDGIRVTNDVSIPGSPRTGGGHLVKGNYVRRANRGIAFQAVQSSVMEDNDVAECLLTGAHIFNMYPATVANNNFHDNYGVGVELLNSSTAANPVTLTGNRITGNGTLNGVAPLRAAPTVTVGTGASSLAPGTYAVSYGYTATVAARGGAYHIHGPVSAPAVVTVAAGQVIRLPAITLPAGTDGIVVCVLPESYVTRNLLVPWYAKPGASLRDFALAVGGLVLGEVAADGGISYDGGATSGLVASVRAGTLRVSITGAATTRGEVLSRSFANASGIWANGATGAVAAVAMEGNTISGNGQAGVMCPGTISGGTISDHTAAGATGVTRASGVTISDAVLGLVPPPSSGGGTYEKCVIRDMAAEGIHFSGAINGQCFSYVMDDCTFSGMPVGVYIDANVGFPGNATRPAPNLVENCTFRNVPTPVSEDGGTQKVVAMGTGNASA